MHIDLQIKRPRSGSTLECCHFGEPFRGGCVVSCIAEAKLVRPALVKTLTDDADGRWQIVSVGDEILHDRIQCPESFLVNLQLCATGYVVLHVGLS